MKTRLRHLLTTSLTAVALTAPAQDFPGLGVSDLWAMNAAFDQQMHQQNVQFCTDWYNNLQAYRAQTGDMSPVNLPFNAMTISNSINEGNQAFYGYLDSMQASSAAMDRSFDNFSGYIRSEASYTDPVTGQTWTAPNDAQLYRGWDGQIYQAGYGQQVDSSYTPVMW